MAIIEEDGLQPSQLAEKIELDRPTTTGLLDRLERDGWVERSLDKDDRRSFRIYLSSKGKKHKAALQNLFESTNRKMLDRFTTEEWTQLQMLLLKLENYEET